MNNTALIEIINENGLSILTSNEKLFEKLNAKFSQEETALFMLIFSKKKCLNELKMRRKTQNEIAQVLRELYHFTHEYALEISGYLLTVFSDSQLNTWDANRKKGVYEFMNSRFKFGNSACVCWRPRYYSNCYLECTLNYELHIGVWEDMKVLEFINSHFPNEFVKKDTIVNFFQSIIHRAIVEDFKDFCTCDDETEPCCDEYSEDILDTLREKYGLEIEVLEWDGQTSNYKSI